jgi:hypothetical protein
MATAAYKKYLFIDHANNRYVFINNTSELNFWFESYNINMATLPVTNGVPNNMVMLDLRTGQVVPIELVINAASIVISI